MGAQRVATSTSATSIIQRCVRSGAIAFTALLVASLMPLVVTSTATATDATCETVPTTPDPSREINLVLDDSGSMFYDVKSGKPLPRWSFAKYSVEVFAALLGTNDTLNLYLLSDANRNTTETQPKLTLTGSQSAAERVKAVHDLPLKGAGTPYVPVESAYQDFAGSEADEKWLVILTDGQFSDYSTGKFRTISETELKGNLDEYTTTGVKIGFLSLGDGAAQIPSDEGKGIFSAQAQGAQDVINVMTQFSNRVFQRNESPSKNQTTWTTDLPLTEVVVFAQGAGVAVGAVETSDGSIEPESSEQVSWAPNAKVKQGNIILPAIPDKSLEGVVATYKTLPEGELTFDIQNATAIDYFYKPDVRFGYIFTNGEGKEVDLKTEKLAENDKYTLNYGIMNPQCEFIESKLLGDVTYSAELTKDDGTVVLTGIRPGDPITLPAGNMKLAMSANYLKGSTSNATVPIFVPADIDIPPPPTGNDRYLVSTMAGFPAAADGVVLTYTIKSNQEERSPTPEEWATFDPTTIAVSSSSNLEYEVVKGASNGQLILLPRAPGGDVFAADTGEIDVTVTAPALVGSNPVSTNFTITVVDDLSATDRWINWLKTVGWKLFLLLLLLIIVIGYIVKPRFSKKVKKRPTVAGIPKAVGMNAVNGNGKFRVNAGRKFIPYVADTATLVYVPSGTPGFQAMKLKAGRGKTMIVTNWKALAKKGNVEVNGTPLDEDTKKAPTFAPSATIAANSPQMTYELTPNL